MASKRDEFIARISGIRSELEKEVRFLFESCLQNIREDNDIKSIFNTEDDFDFCEEDYLALFEIYKSLNNFIKVFNR